MICEAVAVKEDRRYRAGLPTSASEASGDSSGVVPMEEVTTDVKAPLVVNPPVIQLMLVVTVHWHIITQYIILLFFIY